MCLVFGKCSDVSTLKHTVSLLSFQFETRCAPLDTVHIVLFSVDFLLFFGASISGPDTVDNLTSCYVAIGRAIRLPKIPDLERYIYI